MRKNYIQILCLSFLCYLVILVVTCTPNLQNFALNNMALHNSSMGAAQPQKTPDCLKHIFEAESKYKIPSGLLLSIAMVESGRDGTPHPYALNLNGKAVYTDTFRDATIAIRQKNGKVKRNISVGCMQLQVSYHKAGFQTLDHMLKPQDNVDYAAQFLADLHTRTKSWTGAVRRYNGGSNAATQKYLCKVSNHLKNFNADSNKLLAANNCSQRRKPVISEETHEAYKEIKKHGLKKFKG